MNVITGLTVRVQNECVTKSITQSCHAFVLPLIGNRRTDQTNGISDETGGEV